MDIKIGIAYRNAEFTAKWTGHGIESAEQGDIFPVKVHGAFQYMDGEEAYPMFLIEFASGVCSMVGIDHVKLLKEDDEC